MIHIRHSFLLAALVLGSILQAAPPPNILLIVADDLGYGDLGCYGQEQIQTPHLDRLARDGMRFTQAYAGTSVCAPSRCVLYTGRHTGRATVRGNRTRLMDPSTQALRDEDITYAEVLRTRDYATGLIGKWGLGEPGSAAAGLPMRQGFEYFFGYLNQTQAHNSWPTHLWRGETRVPLRNLVPDETPVGAGVASQRIDYTPDLFRREAIEFLRAQRGRPFALTLTPTQPHANNESQPIGLEVPDTGIYAPRDWPEAMRLYAALVTRLDDDVGAVLAELDALGLAATTLVIFSSDNGPHRESGAEPSFFNSAGGLRGIKRDLYEGGIRVPFIARWPGRIPAGRTEEAPIHFADMLPTLAAVAGAAAPEGSDGVSLLPTLLGQPQPELRDRLLLWEFYEGGYKVAARRGDWKVVRPRLDQPWELFDLASDPAETRDLASAHPDKVAAFEAAIREARTDSETWPITLERYAGGVAAPVSASR